MGSFRPGAGNQHLHWYFNFTGCIVETVLKSLSSTGQASAHIPHLSVSHRPVFLLNSCLSLFSAATSQWHPFSRSYGAILPSSLTMLLPSALGFSPHPPVSVYGTGTTYTIAAFLGTPSPYFATLFRFRSPHWIGIRTSLHASYLASPGLLIPGSRFGDASPQF